METLKLRIDGQVFEIDLSGNTSPHTVATLERFLPTKVDLHYAKIAGEEVMGIVPFHSPLERPIEVAQARPGMLVYWPPRQLLCLYYGKIQEETAQINRLGYLKGDFSRFTALGEQVRDEQGKLLHFCEIYFDLPEGKVPTSCPRYSFLDDYEREIWKEMPEEIGKMLGKDGIMRPGGPIVYAETDSRLFHEFLFMVRERIPSDLRDFLFFKKLMDDSLSYFHNKFFGWYGLKRTASIIKNYKESFQKCESVESFRLLLDGFILFVGRISMWIDGLIPWNDINNIFVP